MRRPIGLLLLFVLLAASSGQAATGRVLKVLPHFLDLRGRHSLSPSLYDRDAYQAVLRQKPERVSGMQFDVWWKAKGTSTAPLKLKLELRGVARGSLPGELTLEKEITRRSLFSQWTSIPLTGDEYKKFGNVTAWRATLWEGDKLIGEQKSFLW